MTEPRSTASDDSIDHALAEYRRRVSRGEPVDPEQFVDEFPEAAERLRAFLTAGGPSGGPEHNTAEGHGGGRNGLPPPTDSETSTTWAQSACTTEPPGHAAVPTPEPAHPQSHPATGGTMPPVEQVAAFLAASGLLPADDADELMSRAPGEAGPAGAAGLLDELHQAGRLTLFQCEAIRRGRAAELVLGNYVLIDRLGRGGMGQVYRAWHRKMDRMVALKTLRPGTMNSEKAVERFRREVQAAARLAHPNIVTAYDADESGGVHFLVMELVAGTDLAAHVRRHGPVEVAQAAHWVLQAAQGLAHAHRQGIIHRDVKPGNLLLGDDGVVKVLDMGLARLEERLAGGRSEPTEGLTQTGDVLGTLDYMAPEQIGGTRQVGARADMYSLGCTLHYLLAGKPPYGGRTVSEKLLGHRKQPIPSLRAARADVPEALDRLFQRMVAKRPEDRPADMGEVIAELAPLAAEAGEAADATQTCEVAPLAEALGGAATRPSLRPRRAAVALGAIAIVALALFAAITMVRVRTSEGILVVEVSHPGATIEIVDSEGTVKLTDTSGDEPLVFKVVPGDHRVKVVKDGFKFFAEDVVITRRGQQTVRVALTPKGDEPSAPADDDGRVHVDGNSIWNNRVYISWQNRTSQGQPDATNIMIDTWKVDDDGDGDPRNDANRIQHNHDDCANGISAAMADLGSGRSGVAATITRNADGSVTLTLRHAGDDGVLEANYTIRPNDVNIYAELYAAPTVDARLRWGIHQISGVWVQNAIGNLATYDQIAIDGKVHSALPEARRIDWVEGDDYWSKPLGTSDIGYAALISTENQWATGMVVAESPGAMTLVGQLRMSSRFGGWAFNRSVEVASPADTDLTAGETYRFSAIFRADNDLALAGFHEVMESAAKSTTADDHTGALRNVALAASGAKATAISTGRYLDQVRSPALAIDGDRSRGWCSHWSMPAWLQVEFEREYEIERVGVAWGSYNHTFSISLSGDGENWTTVVPSRATAQKPHYVNGKHVGGELAYETFPIAKTPARFMRIDITSTTAPRSHIFQAAVNELEAYAAIE